MTGLLVGITHICKVEMEIVNEFTAVRSDQHLLN